MANISGVPCRNRRVNNGNAIAPVMAQRLNKLRFHRIIVILEVFKRWAAMEADSPALFATPQAPHRRDLSIMLHMSKCKCVCPDYH
jgi:hypothetical protein